MVKKEGYFRKETISILALFVLVLLAFSVSAQTCIPPPSGLVAWWPGNGNTDETVGGSNGTLINGATFTSGKVGQGFSLDGINDYINLSGDFLSAGLPQGTIEAWIFLNYYPLNSADGVIFNRGDPAETTSLIFRILTAPDWGPPGVLHVSMSNTNAPPSLDQVSLNNFTHVAATWNGTRIKYYINSVSSGDFPFTATVPSGGLKIVGIGRNDQDVGFFPGIIDELEIYNRSLSSEEIKAIFDADSSGKCIKNNEGNDSDNDGIPDLKDKCPKTKQGVEVDQNGCSQIQFCLMQPICGDACDFADWKHNEVLTNPHDCITATVFKEGEIYPACAALVGPMCSD